jgi:prepilin-type N-terminal cleavage/methylation domain-containing protein
MGIVTKHRHTGFTIVELLIVIVVIGILAAIVFVAYNGIQNRAKAGAAQAAVTQATKRLAQFAVESGTDSYPTDQTAFNALNISSGASYQYTVNNSVNPRTFCVTATVQNISFYANNTSNLSPKEGGCQGHAQGTRVAVTNLSTNPRLAVNTNGYQTQTPANSTFARIANNGPNAEASYTVTTTASGQLRIRFYSSSTPVTAGEQLRVSYDFYSDAAYPGYSTEVQFNTGWVQFSIGAISTGWNRYSSVITVPASATSLTGAQVLSATSGVPANATFRITNIMLTKGADDRAFADGETTDWLWNGSRYNSTSTGPAL